MGNPGIDKKCSARAPQAQRPAGTRRSPREGAGKREATPLGGAPSRPGRPPGPHLLRPEQVVTVHAEQAVGLLHALALVHVAGEEDALHVGLQLPRPAAGAAPGALGLHVPRLGLALPAAGLRRLPDGARHAALPRGAGW